jgi:hypothetical protein
MFSFCNSVMVKASHTAAILGGDHSSVRISTNKSFALLNKLALTFGDIGGVVCCQPNSENN